MQCSVFLILRLSDIVNTNYGLAKSYIKWDASNCKVSLVSKSAQRMHHTEGGGYGWVELR